MADNFDLDENLKSDTFKAVNDAQVNVLLNNTTVGFQNVSKPVGYVEAIEILLNEYRLLLKSVRTKNQLLSQRVDMLQKEFNRTSLNEAIATLATYHDGLTGLPNCLLLQDRFLLAKSYADRMQKPLAILKLDLEKYNIIKDKYGHASGDDLLKLIAKRLTSSIRAEDTACRFGGDEFIIMLSLVDTASNAAIIANEIADRLNQPYLIDNHIIEITVGIGMAIYPQDGGTLDVLAKTADAAMYTENGVGVIDRGAASDMNAHRTLDIQHQFHRSEKNVLCTYVRKRTDKNSIFAQDA